MKLSDIILEKPIIENEFAQIAAAIEDELEGEIKDQPVKEAVGVLSIISYVLLSNAVAGLMAKLVKRIAAKQGWEKTEDVAKKVYDWAHANEKAFMAPIERVLSRFMIGPTKKYIPAVTKGLYAIFIFMLAGHYGGEAVSGLKNSQWGASLANTIKSMIKGTEVHTLFQQVVSDLS